MLLKLIWVLICMVVAKHDKLAEGLNVSRVWRLIFYVSYSSVKLKRMQVKVAINFEQHLAWAALASKSFCFSFNMIWLLFFYSVPAARPVLLFSSAQSLTRAKKDSEKIRLERFEKQICLERARKEMKNTTRHAVISNLLLVDVLRLFTLIGRPLLLYLQL